jgi:hypothetical protein
MAKSSICSTHRREVTGSSGRQSLESDGDLRSVLIWRQSRFPFFFFLAEVCFSSAVLYGAEEGISFVFKSCSLSLHRTEIGTKLGRNVLSHRHEQFSSAQWAQPGGT